MKNKIASIFLLNLLVAIVLLVSCSPVVDEEEITAQIPQTVSDVPKITVEELLPLIESNNDIIIVDVRDEEEYIEAHIKGAISVPLPQIDAQEWEPPQDKALVLY